MKSTKFSCSALKLDECWVSRNHLEFELVGASVAWRILYSPHACAVPRKRRCERARFTQLRAWAAPVSGVRGARCACAACSHCVRVAIVTTRTYALLYRSAPPSEFLLAFHRTILCRFFSTSATAFASAFASAFGFCFCIRLLLLHSPLLLHSSLLYICSSLETPTLLETPTNSYSHYAEQNNFMSSKLLIFKNYFNFDFLCFI